VSIERTSRLDRKVLNRLVYRARMYLEFVAFASLADQTKANPDWISGRAQLIASYALCGFGNLASGGISIGILAALAPGRMVDIVRLAPRALITGIIATLSTACIAGTCITTGVRCGDFLTRNLPLSYRSSR
jgi:CNT family concentrative nucleoside transporter